MFSCRAVPETFQGVLVWLAGMTHEQFITQRGKGRTVRKMVQGLSPGDILQLSPPCCSSRACTDLASAVQGLLSRPGPTQCKVLEQSGERICSSWGNALKTYPHCVKRVCQSIFVSALGNALSPGACECENVCV